MLAIDAVFYASQPHTTQGAPAPSSRSASPTPVQEPLPCQGSTLISDDRKRHSSCALGCSDALSARRRSENWLLLHSPISRVRRLLGNRSYACLWLDRLMYLERTKSMQRKIYIYRRLTRSHGACDYTARALWGALLQVKNLKINYASFTCTSDTSDSYATFSSWLSRPLLLFSFYPLPPSPPPSLPFLSPSTPSPLRETLHKPRVAWGVSTSPVATSPAPRPWRPRPSRLPRIPSLQAPRRSPSCTPGALTLTESRREARSWGRGLVRWGLDGGGERGGSTKMKFKFREVPNRRGC